jgi:hypothetical protein
MPSTLTVLNNADSGDGSLRTTIAAARSGDQIVFDPSLQGQTITLTSGELAITQSLDIEGLGADQLAVSGNHASRIFDISGGVAVTIAGLTITDGMMAPGTTDALGGGIFNNGGDVTLEDVILQNNVARGADGRYPHYDGYNARGGGFYSTSGSVTIADSTIASNQAIGGNDSFCCGGVNAGDGAGGSIYVTGGSLTIADSTIADNQAIGGRSLFGGNGGGNGGTGAGGGIYTTGASLNITNSVIASNRGIGGSGGLGCSYTNCHIRAGNGGTSQGGGLYLSGGMLTLTDSAIANNTLQGGDGGDISISGTPGSGGVSQGGGLYLSSAMLTVGDSTISGNTVQGGTGGGGGQAQGGGFYISGVQTTLTVSNATIASNTAFGADSYLGGTGQGGGLWVGAGASAQVTFSTIATNQAIGGNGYGGAAAGGGVYNQGILQTRDTLLARNTVNGPGTNSGPDVDGDLGSLGHNLISNTEGGSGFDPTDLRNVNARLGPLQNNGGPTQTMALLPGSPAIGAGDKTGHPRWDQRGRPYHRVINHRLDIGAFEVQSADPGPSAPWGDRGEGSVLAALVSTLPLRPVPPALWSGAPVLDPAATPSLTRGLLPISEERSGPKIASLDRWFASFHKREPEPGMARWNDLQGTGPVWPLPDSSGRAAGHFGYAAVRSACTIRDGA